MKRGWAILGLALASWVVIGAACWVFVAAEGIAQERNASLKERYESFLSLCLPYEPQYQCEYKWRVMWRL